MLTTGLAAQTTIAGSEGGNDTCASTRSAVATTSTVAPDASTLLTPVVDLGADQ